MRTHEQIMHQYGLLDDKSFMKIVYNILSAENFNRPCAKELLKKDFVVKWANQNPETFKKMRLSYLKKIDLKKLLWFIIKLV